MENLDRQCEKFMGGPTIAASERVHVTLGHHGVIFLNRKAHNMIGVPLAVYLYFNRQKDMIIIEPTSATTSAAAFHIRPFGSGGTGRAIFANPFCKHFGIRVDSTQRFLSPEVDAVGRMYLKLSETVNVARGPKKRKK